MTFRYILLVIFIWFLGCESKPSNDELLAFTSNRNGTSDIYLMQSDGSGQRALVQTEAEEWAPVWINEYEISFLHMSGDTISRKAIDIRSQSVRLQSHPPNCVLDDKNMIYAGEGTKGLYACDGDLFVLEQGVNGALNLTQEMEGASLYPSWNESGDLIIFSNDRNGTNDLYQMDLKTSTVTPLTDSPSNDERGVLSPDGRTLAFSSDKFNPGNQDIFLLNIYQGTAENITQSSGTELIARWSSDGQYLFLGSDKDGDWEIYRYELDSGTLKRLTESKGFDGDPQVYMGNKTEEQSN